MSKPKKGLNILLVVAAVCVSLVTAAFFAAPDRDERGAIERREVLESVRRLTLKGDIASATALLEPLLKEGLSDRASARAVLSHYAATNHMYEHVQLVLGPKSLVPLLKDPDLHEVVALYSARGLPTEATAVAEELNARHAANPAELALIGEARFKSGNSGEALMFARRIAPQLRKNKDFEAAQFVIAQLSRSGAQGEVNGFLNTWIGAKPALPTLLSIAPAMIENGRPDIVVSALAERQTESEEARNTYAFAASKAAAIGGDMRTQLTYRLIDRLKGAKLGKSFDNALSDMLSFGDLTIVADDLGKSDLWRTPAIRPAFVYTLTTRDMKPKLRDLFVEQAALPNNTGAMRRSLATELVGIGFADDGIAVLKDTAIAEGPSGAALADLLYVWQSNDIPADTGWMGLQARTAEPADAEAWIATIAGISPKAAIHEIERIQRNKRFDKLAVMKVRYLAWGGAGPALRTALAQAPAGNLETADRIELGRVACQVGDIEATQRFALTVANDNEGAAIRACATRLVFADARAAFAKGDKARAAEQFADVRRLDPTYLDRLRQQLVGDATRKGATVKQQRALASELLSVGYISDGLSVLKTAAVREGPSGAAFGDLLYVWKANGYPTDTAWMGDQARAANDANADAWIAKIAEISPEAAIGEIDRIQATKRSDHLNVVKVRYLAWGGVTPALRTAVTIAANGKLSAADQAELGTIACQISDSQSVVRLAATAGTDKAGRDLKACATRMLVASARDSLAGGNKARALDQFAEARQVDDASLTAQDYADWAGLKPTTEAPAQLYAAALDRIPEDAPDDANNEMMRAGILTELKRYSEAQQVLEQVVATTPDNHRARVMLAEIYLIQKDYRRALELSRRAD